MSRDFENAKIALPADAAARSALYGDKDDLQVCNDDRIRHHVATGA